MSEQPKTIPPVDLDAPGVKKAIALRIKADIDKHCEATYADGHRTHLGASIIGHECSRYLWYVFRWISEEKFNGRMHRLFNRGHQQEPLLWGYLRGIGCQVWDLDESGNQYRMSAVMGHYGGSIDAVAKLPAHYNVPGPMLVSCKTNGTGAGFNNLSNDGVKMSKPQHYAQESAYGRAFNIKHALYVNTNKNDDDQYIEVVELDFKLAEQLEQKAERIILAQEPPSRLSESPAFMTCKQCWFGNDRTGICFNKPGHSPVDRNCRSCKNASAGENKSWLCAVHADKGPIPVDVIKVGCPHYDTII